MIMYILDMLAIFTERYISEKEKKGQNDVAKLQKKAAGFSASPPIFVLSCPILERTEKNIE